MEYHFKNFALDPAKFELRKKGNLIPVEPQVFLLLRLLIENADRMVSKDEIVDTVWGGSAVSDASIASRIRSARNAIGDDGKAQHTIRTVHGRGFRFVAELATQPVDCTAQVREAPGAANPQEPVKTTKPSIVVLPFQLLGATGQGIVLAEAIPHELIQALSRLRWLLVIARGSAFRFRSMDRDVKAIGNALNVRYVLAGSVEALDRSLAVTVELSDSRSGEVVWGDRFASTLEAVHDIRSLIVARVISSLEVYIPLNEARAARLGVSENLDAWSNYHLGLQHMYRFTMEDNAKATGLFQRAVEQDPGFARAHAGLSFTSFQDAFVRYNEKHETAALAARRFAERSIELDSLDPFSNFTMGRSYLLEGDLDSCGEWLDRAITLSPNFAQGYYSRAFADMLSCKAETARSNVETAVLLSPLDPFVYGMLGTRALSFIIDGDYESAAQWAEKAARAPGAHFLIAMIAVSAYALNRNRDKAEFWTANVRGRRPDASQDHFFESFPFSDAGVRQRISDALARYGL